MQIKPEKEPKYRIIYIRERSAWQHWEMVGPYDFKVVGKRKCSRAEITDRLTKWIVKHKRGLPNYKRGDLFTINHKI